MKSTPLLNVVDNVTGGPAWFSGVRPYFATADIEGATLRNGVSVTFEDRPSRANLVGEPGDVLFAKMQATEKVFHITDEASEAIFSTGFFNVRPRRPKIHSRYLFWFLRSDYFQAEKDRLCTGATQKALTLGGLEKISIPLPDTIEEQASIAANLDKADAIRRKRDQALALADDFLRSAYLNLVGLMHPSYQDWEPASIGSLAEDKRGSIRSGPFGSALLHGEFVGEGIAVLGIDNAVKNKFQWAERRFISHEKYEELRRYRVYPKDVIITIMGTTGRSAVVPDDIPEAITTKHLASITCDLHKVLPEILSFAIHSDPVVIDQIRAANKGAIMDGLNLGIIRQIKIRRPPMLQQRLFADLLQKTHATIRKMTTPAGEGSELYSSLSQRAFRGEL